VAPAPSASSTSAAASAPAADSGHGDWYYIMRASSGILLFGVPWWFLSQVRDDAAFRFSLEGALPAALPLIRAALPAFAPQDAPDCYRLVERPAVGEGSAAGATPPPPPPAFDAPLPALAVGLRGARGSLETAATLRGVADGARARAAALRAAAATAAARAAAGAASLLHAQAAEDAARAAEAAAAHAGGVAGEWARGAPRRTWAPPPPPPSPASGLWLQLPGWAPPRGGDGGEGALAAGGSDEARPALWRRPRAARAFFTADEERAVADRLATLRCGALAGALAAAEAAAPPADAPPAPPAEEPWTLERVGRAARDFFAPQPPLDALQAAPAAVDVQALPRCAGCGAWGVGVVQPGGSGRCAHCERGVA